MIYRHLTSQKIYKFIATKCIENKNNSQLLKNFTIIYDNSLQNIKSKTSFSTFTKLNTRFKLDEYAQRIELEALKKEAVETKGK